MESRAATIIEMDQKLRIAAETNITITAARLNEVCEHRKDAAKYILRNYISQSIEPSDELKAAIFKYDMCNNEIIRLLGV